IVGGGSNNSVRLQSLIAKGRAGAPAAAPLPTRAMPARPVTATTAEDLYRDAVRQRNEKDYAAANRSLERALELRPDWLPAVAARASNYAAERKYDEAIAGFGRAIQIDPRRAASYDSRGLAYSNSGRHAEAIPDYTRAIQLNPDLVAAYNNRG